MLTPCGLSAFLLIDDVSCEDIFKQVIKFVILVTCGYLTRTLKTISLIVYKNLICLLSI